MSPAAGGRTYSTMSKPPPALASDGLLDFFQARRRILDQGSTVGHAIHHGHALLDPMLHDVERENPAETGRDVCLLARGDDAVERVDERRAFPLRRNTESGTA